MGRTLVGLAVTASIATAVLTALAATPVLAQASVAGVGRAQPPVLTRFAINDTATVTTAQVVALELAHALAGSPPTEFRVSARADFANALWMPYTTPLRLTGWQSLMTRDAPCDGRRPGQRLQLYLQVRADLGGEVQIVNGQRELVPRKVESNVVSDAICVVR
jgi:hypothetical protein